MHFILITTGILAISAITLIGGYTLIISTDKLSLVIVSYKPVSMPLSGFSQQ